MNQKERRDLRESRRGICQTIAKVPLIFNVRTNQSLLLHAIAASSWFMRSVFSSTKINKQTNKRDGKGDLGRYKLTFENFVSMMRQSSIAWQISIHSNSVRFHLSLSPFLSDWVYLPTKTTIKLKLTHHVPFYLILFAKCIIMLIKSRFPNET